MITLLVTSRRDPLVQQEQLVGRELRVFQVEMGLEEIVALMANQYVHILIQYSYHAC